MRMQNHNIPTRTENALYLLAFALIALMTGTYCLKKTSYMHGALDQHYYEARQHADAEDAYTWALGTANLKSKQIIAKGGN